MHKRYSLMITREYVFLFLVGTCFLLDYSSQTPCKLSSKAGLRLERCQPGGGLETGQGGGRGRWKLQRNKRGWVWNQFFVLEEYMGSDPQYVGKRYSMHGARLKC
ncbi:hypothetical protein F7725_012003 [Dissostichus mawsoni]|uniref:Uncharacterized protein n=1 Tax=Dissostichus mawsoni TaxID=36200 RepID=A0A7J5ZAE5_DISMA|nr:hypothetical protein F7725_012003 [Dissostichus mawsoni]